MINERTGTIVLGGDVKLTPVSVIHGNLSIQVVTSYAWCRWAACRVGWSEGNRGGRAEPEPPALEAARRQAGEGRQRRRMKAQRRRARAFCRDPTAALVPEQNLNVNDAPAQTMRLDEGANVEELVNGLHAIGTTAHDVVAILQAIKAEGGMQAELEVQ